MIKNFAKFCVYKCDYEQIYQTMKRRKDNKVANKVRTPNQVRKLIWNQHFLSIIKSNIMGNYI